MYESFFNFQEKPFSLTPNPRFLFLSKTHNEVYAHLIYGIENRCGFVEVTGEVGTGKTTILRALLAYLDENKHRVAFIFNPKLTAFELLKNINREFGVADDGLSNPDLIHSLNEFLLSENQAGRTPILVIDEAQNLSGEVLEQIRLLSNLETEEDKLIQIILVGQPELRKHLSDHSLRQLNQRIAVRYHLRSLNKDETTSYILNRLKIAGRADREIFKPSAIKSIFKASDGIPRKINLICDRALLTAFTENRRSVSARDVKQAVAELAGIGEDGFSGQGFPWKPISVSVVVLLLIVMGYFAFGVQEFKTLDISRFFKAEAQHLELTDSESKKSVSKSSESKPVASLQLALPEQTSLEEDVEIQDSLTLSVNALFSIWDAPLIDASINPSALDLDRELSARGFKLARLPGKFEELRKYNVPLLIPLSEEQGGGYVAVLEQIETGFWSVAPAFEDKEALETGILNNIGMNMALIPWVDFAEIGSVVVPGTRGEHVRRLQYLLGLAGCVDVPTNGRFDSRTINCVKSFQREQNLVVDGLVGPRTLILIYQVAGAYEMPKLS